MFLLLSSHSAYACYDESQSGKAKFDNCMAQVRQGDLGAVYMLGVLYSTGEGVIQDDKKAVLWYTRAAEYGHPVAQSNLGSMYYQGKGVTQDYKQAAKWYRKSAEQGYAGAQNNLGVLYRDGKAVTQDYEQAVKWYTKAAEQGDTNAQIIIGDMYLRGVGVIQDKVLAHMWFNIANIEDSYLAREKMDRIAKEMSPSQIEKAQDMAREWVAKH